MNQNINKNLVIFFVIIVAAIAGYAVYHHCHYQTVQDQKESLSPEKQAEIKREHIIKQLATEYNAIVDWDKNIDYTIQLQKLLTDERKPIVFTGNPIDVFKKDDKYYIRFLKSSDDLLSLTKFYFTLECDVTTTSMILSKQPPRKDEFSFSDIDLWEKGTFAVVAKINKITKPSLQITGLSDEEGSVDFEYSPSNTFLLEGKCIAVSYLGN